MDLITLNGNVITMDPNNPMAEAVAVKFNIIIEVGTNDEVKKMIGKQTKVIDVKGKTVVPGFHDCHIHPLIYGMFKIGVDLSDAKSLDECIEKVEEKVKATPKGQIVLGFGWNQENWEEKREPTRWDIDKVSPDNPVLLCHYNLHVHASNSHLLKSKNITKSTPDPEGGKIDRDPKTGEPTGMLRESALDLVAPGLLESGGGVLTYEQMKECVKLAVKTAPSLGLTCIGSVLADAGTLRCYQELYKSGELPVRVRVFGSVELCDEFIKAGIRTGFGNPRLRIQGVKIISDGSLSSRTAAMEEPYEDDPTKIGDLRYAPEELKEIVGRMHKGGLQVEVHAIGDRANAVTLDAVENALKELPVKDPRFRIAHCIILNRELIEKYKKLGVIADMQPLFVMKGQYWISRMMGDRAAYAHAWRSLLNAGVKLCASTDCPVEPMNPILNLYAAVTRMDMEGKPEGGWYPEQRLTVEEALRMLTIDAAYATFEENTMGSIEEGKLADMVVLSDDPFSTPSDKLKDIEVEMTILDGEVVYAKSQSIFFEVGSK